MAEPTETDVLHIRLTDAPIDVSPGQQVTAMCGAIYVTSDAETTAAKTHGCANCTRALSEYSGRLATEYNDLIDRVEAARGLLDPKVQVSVHRHTPRHFEVRVVTDGGLG